MSKREFRDALRLRYDWPVPDTPSVCVCGCSFTLDHAMIYQRGGLVIQRHNEIRDLQAELLDMVCYDVEIEPSLQVLTGEELNRQLFLLWQLFLFTMSCRHFFTCKYIFINTTRF